MISQLAGSVSSLTPPTAALQRWDTLLARRDVPGIAGADAHSRLPVTRRRSVRFPSYASVFALAQNHVLLERPLHGAAVRVRVLERGADREPVVQDERAFVHRGQESGL
jgi:hypothetical protein